MNSDRPNEAKSYMWVLANGSEAHHPIRYFEYGPGRGQSVAERLLLDFKGYLVTDDYLGITDSLTPPDVVVGRMCAESLRRCHG